MPERRGPRLVEPAVVKPVVTLPPVPPLDPGPVAPLEVNSNIAQLVAVGKTPGGAEGEKLNSESQRRATTEEEIRSSAIIR